MACPQAVLLALREEVQKELDKATAIMGLSSRFNQSLVAFPPETLTALRSAVDAIPLAATLTVLDLAEYILCPLTPLALGLDLVDFEDLDPLGQLEHVKRMQGALITQAKKDFELAVRETPDAGTLQQVRTYTREVTRTKFDTVSFARAAFITTTVASLDPDEYAIGPYPRFAALADTFSMTDGFPSNLSDTLAPVVAELNRAESKFNSLKEALL